MLICPASCCIFRSHLLNDSYGFKEKVASLAVMDARLFSGYAQILTRTAERDHIHGINLSSVDFRHIAKLFHMWEPRRRYLQRIRLDLACPYRLNSVNDASQRETAGPVKKTAKFHSSASCTFALFLRGCFSFASSSRIRSSACLGTVT